MHSAMAGLAEDDDVRAAFVAEAAVAAMVDREASARMAALAPAAGSEDPQAAAQPPDRRAQVEHVQD